MKTVIDLLHLEPLEIEGGWFTQTYVSSEMMAEQALPGRYGSERPFYTAIYYLLTGEADCFSALHRLTTDEIWHFYLGCPAELLLLYPDGTGETRTLGQDILQGELLQFCVPAGVWQGCRLKKDFPGESDTADTGRRYALMGTTMAPAFHSDDFELGSRHELITKYPEFEEKIQRLTRGSF